MPRLLIDIPRQKLAELCKKHGVARLWVFGSAVALEGEPPAFDVERSDVDFLVEFSGGTQRRGFDDPYFLLKHDLTAMLGREADLVELSAVRNPYFLAAVQAARVPLYAAA